MRKRFGKFRRISQAGTETTIKRRFGKFKSESRGS
jgi:hypothetical protein